MGAYEEKQRKEREALDEKFKAQARPLADRLREGVEKATGLKIKESTQEGSYAISLWIDEPRIEIKIEHDWGAGRYYHYSKQPMGTAKIGLNISWYRGPGSKSWYRPGKDGSFNLDGIVKKVAERVESHQIGEKSRKEGEIREAENKAAQADELKGIKLPDGVVVTRNYGPDTYTFQFAGTFSDLNVFAVADLAESFKKLIEQYKFEKSWRMDF